MSNEKKINAKYGESQQWTHRHLIPANLQIASSRSSLKRRLEVLKTSTEAQRPSAIPAGRILDKTAIVRQD